jgi:uncharacterized membrane protein YesL
MSEVKTEDASTLKLLAFAFTAGWLVSMAGPLGTYAVLGVIVFAMFPAVSSLMDMATRYMQAATRKPEAKTEVAETKTVAT